MRKSRAKKRLLLPDPKYGSEMVSKFVNYLMLDGKKSTAYQIVYGAFEIIEQKTQQPGIEIFQKALGNVMPAVEVKSRRVGGATFQVPTEVKPERQIALGMKWIIKYTRDKSGKSMRDKLAADLIAASKGEGSAVKKKDDTHRMAEANKAFAHFRF
ncbi:MAG: 30S ribosomal protein S7 [Bacteroidia bacterium]|nr:30S ribosomal protein S7 [Bacteroidia bacterium]